MLVKLVYGEHLINCCDTNVVHCAMEALAARAMTSMKLRAICTREGVELNYLHCANLFANT